MIAGQNGAVWYSGDQGNSYTPVEASGFSRISVAPDSTVWAVGGNGQHVGCGDDKAKAQNRDLGRDQDRPSARAMNARP